MLERVYTHCHYRDSRYTYTRQLSTRALELVLVVGEVAPAALDELVLERQPAHLRGGVGVV